MYVRYRARPNPAIPTISSALAKIFLGFLKKVKSGSDFFAGEIVNPDRPRQAQGSHSKR
jgi:hypothetical protein